MSNLHDEKNRESYQNENQNRIQKNSPRKNLSTCYNPKKYSVNGGFDMENEFINEFSQEEKEIAFWMLQNGFAVTPMQALRFMKAARENDCTDEVSNAFTIKILLDRGLATESFGNLENEIPIVTNEEIMGALNHAISTAKHRIEMWKEVPRDTNARFFYSNLKRVEWDKDEV